MELNRVICQDALEGLRSLPDESVDFILTDPPYNLGKNFENDNLNEDDFIAFLTPILDEMARVIKPKRSIVVFFDSGKKLPLFWRCLFASRLHFQKACTFYKPNDCSMPHNRTLRKSEVFYILSKTPEINHEGESYIHDCLIGNHTKKEGWYHPTAKNLKIIREIVKANTLPGWIVLDPFMGSGTTAVAAHQIGRYYLGFELNPEYVKITEERIRQKTLLGVLS